MKVRLHGTPTEVQQAAARLKQVFTVLSVSRAYPDRGASSLVRVYVEITAPTPTPATTPTTPAAPAPPPVSIPTTPASPAPTPLSAIPLEIDTNGGPG